MTDARDLHEEEQVTRVRAHLRELIQAQGGFLSFERYMNEALYAPGLGYYSGGARKLGPGGDFTTAPEISGLFGACLAGQIEPVLRALPGSDILELGAGTGRLARDVLLALARRNALPQRYMILEVSADLRGRQRQLLGELPAALAARVEFLHAPPSAGWRGVLLANEVLDALPCEAFALREAGICQRGVGLDQSGEFRWIERPAPSELSAEIRRCLASLPEPPELGYESEICRYVGPWIAEISASLLQGVALFIDYGLPRGELYHRARSRGTLRCHYRQRAHDDPFLYPGAQDITVWVDFTRVAEAADDCGMEVLGFATQAAFLLGTGIESLIAAAPDGGARARLVVQARALLMPDEMGEVFKVMALGRGWKAPLAAFAHQDLRERL